MADKELTLKNLKGQMIYLDNCVSLGNNLSSPIYKFFRDATEMAQAVDEDNEDVVTLTKEEMESLMANNDKLFKGDFYLNTYLNIAWSYNFDEDIHYFYSVV